MKRGCKLNRRICAYDADAGHLEVLQWARANNCPWDEDTCTKAAAGGHLGVLQWVGTSGCSSGRGRMTARGTNNHSVHFCRRVPEGAPGPVGGGAPVHFQPGYWSFLGPNVQA